ncbi:unnamed protein product, partial [Ectocarpus sp. 4 AP-2014]
WCYLEGIAGGKQPDSSLQPDTSYHPSWCGTLVSSWHCANINCRCESFGTMLVLSPAAEATKRRDLIGHVSLKAAVWYNQSGTFSQRLSDRMRRGLAVARSPRYVVRHARHMTRRDTSLSLLPFSQRLCFLRPAGCRLD